MRHSEPLWEKKTEEEAIERRTIEQTRKGGTGHTRYWECVHEY